jgi:alginate O-acetyltransferase complex protein AlgI
VLFNSPEFLFLFLPITYLGWRFARLYGVINPFFFLILASLFFYGYWQPSSLIILLISLGSNFTLGRLIIRKTAPAVFFFFGILFNLALLFYFKYAEFLATNLESIFGFSTHFIKVALPLGISFFTFQKIAFLADSKAGKIKEISLTDYCLFVTFFPQLIAGPIVHHKAFIDQLKPSTREDLLADLAHGLSLFTFGLFKKVFIADKLATFANPIFNEPLSEGLNFYSAWVGALSYTLQLYFDFSGYSDMALGLARIFGINLPVNFNSPYQATSIIDFWRRWHMTLSVFLRDYVYIPLGGSQNGRFRKYINVFSTMLIGGIWHGAGWCFIAWGLYHAIGITLNHFYRDFIVQKISAVNQKLILFFSVPATFIFTILGWVIFRSSSHEGASNVLEKMLNIANPTMPAAWQPRFGEFLPHAHFIGPAPSVPIGWILASLILVFFAPNTNAVFATSPDIPKHRLQWSPSLIWLLLSAVLFTASISAMTSVSEFLYFQF